VIRLREAIEEFLLGWRDDLGTEWAEILAGIAPNLDVVPAHLTLESGEVIFPGRKGHPPEGARADAHVFRSLDGMRLQDVKAVVLGQDPYPDVFRATGRSFEQGNLAVWEPQPSKVAESLRRIVQSVAQFRTGDERYVTGDSAWVEVVTDIEAGTLLIEQPQVFFDHWQSQGILCLNAGLTLSRFQSEVQRAHIALWRPVVERILEALVTRENRPIVFLLWGQVAATTFTELGVQQAAQNAGTAANLVTVRYPHPGAEKNDGTPMFFSGNTFREANQALTSIGGPALSW
jgi:uracil-DNA glycosylase